MARQQQRCGPEGADRQPGILASAWSERAASEGITQGSLFVPEGYLTLPLLQ